MIISLILFIFVLILLLLKVVSIRIVYSNDLRIELDYYPFLIVLRNFNKKKKKNKIKFRLVFKRIIRLLNVSRLNISSLPPKINDTTANTTHGIIYSLLYPTLAYISTKARVLTIDKRQTKDTLDITLDVRLYLIIKQLLLLVFDIAKENFSGKHA